VARRSHRISVVCRLGEGYFAPVAQLERLAVAKVFLMPAHVVGGFTPALPFAKKLMAHGHQVLVGGVPDIEDSIRASGVEFVPMFEGVQPRGSIPRLAQEEREGKNPFPELMRIERERMALLQGRYLDTVFAASAPDVVIVDSTAASMVVAALGSGIHTLQYGAQLLSVPDPWVPPFDSPLNPKTSPLFGFRNWLAWKGVVLKSRFFELTLFNELKTVRQLAGRLGVPPDVFTRQGGGVRIDVPELIFCPKELDLPRRVPLENVFFCEPSVDLTRSEPEFDFSKLDPKKPLIYCALGTLAATLFPDKTRRILATVLEALKLRPQWQGVVALGESLDPDTFEVPPNVQVARKAPQLALLKRAAAAVLHGGFNSVKEAIQLGVPALIMPVMFDQAYNGLCMEFHGVGLRGESHPKRVRADPVVAQLEQLMTDPKLKSNLQSFQQLFEKAEHEALSLQLVQRALAQQLPKTRLTNRRVSA